jgi:hypothetical protein
MATCNTCGKQFHACSSCYLDYDWEYKHCNTNCWTHSTTFKDMYDCIAKVVSTLNEEQKAFLVKLNDLDDRDYWLNILNNIITKGDCL